MGRAGGPVAGERPLVHGLLRAASHWPVRQPETSGGAAAHKFQTRGGRRGRVPFALPWSSRRTGPESVRYAPGLNCQGSPRPHTGIYPTLSLSPSYARRGASIPCGLSRLRILAVTTGVWGPTVSERSRGSAIP